jgi:hypothetical protein
VVVDMLSWRKSE